MFISFWEYWSCIGGLTVILVVDGQDENGLQLQSAFWSLQKLTKKHQVKQSICHSLAYHGIGGISLGMFFVLQGALKLPAQFLPKIPPRMVRGKPTEVAMK